MNYKHNQSLLISLIFKNNSNQRKQRKFLLRISACALSVIVLNTSLPSLPSQDSSPELTHEQKQSIKEEVGLIVNERFSFMMSMLTILVTGLAALPIAGTIIAFALRKVAIDEIVKKIEEQLDFTLVVRMKEHKEKAQDLIKYTQQMLNDLDKDIKGRYPNERAESEGIRSRNQVEKANIERKYNLLSDLSTNSDIEGNVHSGEQARANFLASIGKHKEAIEAYSKIIENYHGELQYMRLEWIYFSRGDAKYHQEDYQAAISDYLEVVRINGQNHKTYLYLGNSYAALNKITESIQYYEKAIEICNEKIIEVDNRISALSLASSFSDIQNRFKLLNEEKQENEKILLWSYHCKADALRKEEKYDEKEVTELYERALGILPYASTYNSLGDMYLELNQPDSAICAYTEALSLAPDLEDEISALARCGDAQMQKGRSKNNVNGFEHYRDAAISYQRAIEAGGHVYPRIWASWGKAVEQMHRSKRDGSKVIPQLSRSKKCPPQDKELPSDFIFPDVATKYELAVQKSKHKHNFFDLAVSYAIQGEMMDALKALEEAIKQKEVCKGWARKDRAFEQLRDNAEFKKLIRL